jgi:hypothetical protein
MKLITRPTAAVILLLLSTLLATAQQKRQTPAKPQSKAPAAAPAPAPTFDTLLPADCYVIYGEVRGAGQLIRSPAVNELLEPVLKLTGPPKEFKSIVKFLNAHSEELMTSRLFVATWPTNSNVPDVMIAIEFASAEEAIKFANPLNEFLPTILDPHTPPKTASQSNNAPAPKPTAPSRSTFHVQRLGSLVVFSPRPWTMKQLKPAGSRLLAEDVNFRAARNRFNSEPVFVFVDVKTMNREQEERRKHYEQMDREAEDIRRAAAKAKAEKPEAEQKSEPPETEATPAPELVAELQMPPAFDSESAKETPTPDPISNALSAVSNSFFGGESNGPEGVGIALSYEGDSFDLRALFINAPGEKSDAVPFWPRMIPGAPIAPESPNVLPANTELFVTMSLDLPQIYATMSKPTPPSELTTLRGQNVALHNVEFEPPFAALEQRLQINIKDDLLPLLGSEVAVALPMHNLNLPGLPGMMVPRPAPKNDDTKAEAVEATPIILISVKDKEQVRALMPKLIDSLGFKGASSFAQTERREDTELVSYMNLFAYAFVGNFLVISGDAATTRRVVDSYLKHETLATDSHFKNYTRWQPRQLHGQIYISPSLMESFKTAATIPDRKLSEQARTFLTGPGIMAQPVTYSLSNEGFGPLHELHLPKSLLLMAVATFSAELNPAPAVQNERMAIGLMYHIASAQETYKVKAGNGSLGTLEQLIAADLIPKEAIEKSGYRFDVTVSGDKFELSAVPTEYGKTGTMSLFTDQTRVLRGGDRNGAAATSSDPPLH